MTVREALRGKPQDSEILLSFILKKDKAWIFANPGKTLNKSQETSYQKLIQKCKQHWPVAYLTGHKEFYGLDFKVDQDVLIPRPETELLVELALERIKNRELGIKNVIDVGTGSGTIIITISKILATASILEKLKLFAIDVSSSALKIAKVNAGRHGVARKIKFVRGNLLDPLFRLPLRPLSFPPHEGGLKGGRGRSLIIANLPYLTPRQMKNPDLKHEPKNALVAGKDGLKYYRELFKQIKIHNSPNPSYLKRGIPPL